MTPARICLVTTSQPAANPRLVKEADALTEAGYDVRVAGAHWIQWADGFDADLLARRRWSCELLDWRRSTQPRRFWRTRVRHFAARRLARYSALRPWVADAALNRVGPDLRALAMRGPADLFIAHNLGALPSAVAAARHFGVPVGFDAEDFHSGQLSRAADEQARRLTEYVERQWIRRCDYVTAAAPTIADAYAQLCGIPRPTPVLNAFPLSDRPASFRREVGSPLSLCWYSQTIGPDRGLESAVKGMALLPPGSAVMHVRGRWHDGYEHELRHLAQLAGLAPDALVSYAPAPPVELTRWCATHDIGLAVDPPVTINNDLLIPNKFFTYLLAGCAVVATNTRGQQWLARQLGSAVSLCDAA